MSPLKLQKQSVFWPQMRPEAKIFAVIVAGRVNLAKESPKNLKKAVVTSKRLWRHPSSADSDHIFGRFQ